MTDLLDPPDSLVRTFSACLDSDRERRRFAVARNIIARLPPEFTLIIDSWIYGNFAWLPVAHVEASCLCCGGRH